MTREALLASDLRLGDASVSIQRVAVTPKGGRSPNLGAAPYVVLSMDRNELRVVVPVARKEALWVGVMLPAGAELQSATAGGSLLPVEVRAGDSLGTRFVRSSSFGTKDCATAQVAVVDVAGASMIRIELSSVEAFNRRFDLAWSPDPQPSTYCGWRLP